CRTPGGLRRRDGVLCEAMGGDGGRRRGRGAQEVSACGAHWQILTPEAGRGSRWSLPPCWYTRGMPAPSHPHAAVVEATGHLIDSGLLNTIFDTVIAHEGSFEVQRFDIGRTNDDESRLELRVST